MLKCFSHIPSHIPPNLSPTDINECDTNQCGANSDCTNSLGTYTCVCTQGYQLDNNVCVDINECDSNPCAGSQVCTNTVGSHLCQGPCATNPCSSNQECVDAPNQVDGYTCTCRSGYVDSQAGCVMASTCNPACDSSTQECQVTNSGPQCTCKTGYIQQGNLCVGEY